jgi:multisubunit Na+/H+ antiporter MnhB subunit
MIFGVTVAALLIAFYALPFRRVAGGAAAGEFALAIGVGFFLVLTGALARWGTLRSYRAPNHIP